MTLGDFSQQANSYRRSRPAYPAELLDAVISDARVIAGDPVADFGAGTGIMTQMLVEKGFDVSAIEPNQSMRELANVPEARWLAGSFEDSQLGASSQRWAVAAQAFHWADPVRSLPEIRRILQPSSLFTVVWNDRVHGLNDIVAWTENAIRRHVPEFDEAYRKRPWDEILVSTHDFVFVNRRTVRHTIPMTRERFLELWRSHNRLNAIAGPARFASLFNDLATYLDSEDCQIINVHYDCNAWSARRVDD